jgi:predicted kinase
MLLILTGPPASGKNTVAGELVKLLDNCVIVDVDILRQMLVKPHAAPWQGEEGHRQRLLGVRNACDLAKNFIEQGLNVIILDVLTDETAQTYRQSLRDYSAKIVQLLPSWEIIQQRSSQRQEFLQASEIELLFQEQLRSTEFDERIDNSDLSSGEVATKIVNLLWSNLRL